MNEWIFKDDAEPQGSSAGFWYDMVDGGYIKLEDLLVSEIQIQKLKDAVAVVSSFEQALGDNELMNEF